MSARQWFIDRVLSLVGEGEQLAEEAHRSGLSESAARMAAQITFLRYLVTRAEEEMTDAEWDREHGAWWRQLNWRRITRWFRAGRV